MNRFALCLERKDSERAMELNLNATAGDMKPANSLYRKFWTVFFGVVSVTALSFSARAQQFISVVSSTPEDGATDVSATQALIATFSAPVDPGQMTSQFYDDSFNLYSATSSWSSDDKTVTNTPVSPWPTNTTIHWAISGQDSGGTPAIGTGSFTTGSSGGGGGGGGGGGSGTNAITTFSAMTLYNYAQTSAAAPVPDTNAAYDFDAIVVLSSNRTATAVSVAVPGDGTKSLSQNPFAHEDYTFFDYSTDLSAFTSDYPSGNYDFTVESASSNQQVTVNLPSTLIQPGAPHISNYDAAQSIDATQPFTLQWDAFSGGGGPGFISVDIGNNVFQTPTPGHPGVLTSSATSVVIPPNTLQPGTNYDATVTFYEYLVNSNKTYATIADRATLTQFSLGTSSGGGGTVSPPQISGSGKAGNGSFNLTVQCTPNATNTVWYSTNLTDWHVLMTTNPPSGQFTISDSLSDAHRFYRVSTWGKE